MLFGNLIFIKKSGGDGSRFPVTNKSLKIGRSDDCIIRIQNPLISPEHCQLTVDDNGQAKIRNLSSTNPTVLNDKPLGNGEFVLHQGDVFKLGERYARWEYHPTSKYYCQPSSSSENLAEAVSPQVVESEGNNSANVKKALQRRFTGLTIPERASVRTMRLSLGATKGTPNKSKLLDRRSLGLKRLPLSPQVRIRRSATVETLLTPNSNAGNRTPLRRNATWEVKKVTPEKGKSPKVGTNRKSTPIKMPMTHLINDSVVKSTIRTGSKIPNLLPITETSPPTSKVTAARSLDEVLENLNLSPKSPLKLAKTPTPKKIKRTSARKSISKSNKKQSFSRSLLMDEVENLPHSETTEENRRNSWKLTPSGKASLRKSMLRKSVLQGNLEDVVSSKEKETPRKVTTTHENKKLNLLVNITRMEQLRTTPKHTPIKPETKLTPEQSKTTPLATAKYSERLSRGKKSIPSGVLSTPKDKENVKGSPRGKTGSGRKSLGVPTKKTSPQRGKKRDFSAVASAERAAKKLKTIAPTKPDKNKKAALLVLGKASRKMRALQNTNVVIKQKIVKKAIKQSTKSQKRVKPQKKTSSKKSDTPRKEIIDHNKKSPVLSPRASTSSRRHSTPIGKMSAKDISPSKKINTPSKPTPGKRGNKSPTTSVLPQVSCLENLNASVPSKASENKNDSVLIHGEHSPVQCNSQVFDSASRRVSKRLNSSNFDSQTDFTELSPTALGLTPKNVAEAFKTPRPQNRRSSSFVTPRNKGSPGIIKSASTSKINRKSVRFSKRDLNNSSFLDVNITGDTNFDFDDIRTPNVTIDRFISPLSSQKTPKIRLKSPNLLVKSIQGDISFMESKESPARSHSANRSLSRSPRSPKNAETSQVKEIESGKSLEGKKGQLQKSPENDLTDVEGVRQLLKTPRPKKSPKNDLTDVKGVRQLLKTPQPKKSPKNDLTDVKGVRRLLKTPQPRRSPRNDLTDVRGVRRLMESPRQQKSPKNDLTDVRGVKRLMDPPKQQKSPKNDLTDVKGVRRLLESPRQRKSPRNDLTDVTGVKQLLVVKSPKNDLADVSGLESLFKSPPNKSQCLRTSDTISRTPKNDLSDVSGVRQLFSMNKDNNNLNVSFTGVSELFLSPEKSESTRKRARNDSNIAPVSSVDVDSSENKPALRRTARSTSKAVKEPTDKRKSKVTAVKSPVKSDKESPRVIKTRSTRNTRATKATVEVKRSTKTTEQEENDDTAVEETSSRSTRATRRQPVKRQLEDSKVPSPVKRTRKVTLVEEKVATPAKSSAVSKAKMEHFDDASPARKPSPIRTRRKSVARQSPKPVKRNTRSQTKVNKAVVVSPVKTRQRKAKEMSPAGKKTKSSPIRTRTRRRAK